MSVDPYSLSSVGAAPPSNSNRGSNSSRSRSSSSVVGGVVAAVAGAVAVAIGVVAVNSWRRSRSRTSNASESAPVEGKKDRKGKKKKKNKNKTKKKNKNQKKDMEESNNDSNSSASAQLRADQQTVQADNAEEEKKEQRKQKKPSAPVVVQDADNDEDAAQQQEESKQQRQQQQQQQEVDGIEELEQNLQNIMSGATTPEQVMQNTLDQLGELCAAALSGDMAKAVRLLDAGADVNAAEKGGLTPLASAACNSNVAMVKMLLDRGAEPNNEDPTKSPLMLCVINYVQTRDFMTQMMQANPNLARERLHSVRQMKLEMVDVLLRAGADMHTKSPAPPNLSILQLGITYLETEFLELFVKYCKQLEPPGVYEFKHIFLACLAGKPRAIELLIGAGANVNEIGDEGVTPIQVCMQSLPEHRNPDVVKVLALNGADLSMRNDKGEDAWQVLGDDREMRKLVDEGIRRAKAELKKRISIDIKPRVRGKVSKFDDKICQRIVDFVM